MGVLRAPKGLRTVRFFPPDGRGWRDRFGAPETEEVSLLHVFEGPGPFDWHGWAAFDKYGRLWVEEGCTDHDAALAGELLKVAGYGPDSWRDGR